MKMPRLNVWMETLEANSRCNILLLFSRAKGVMLRLFRLHIPEQVNTKMQEPRFTILHPTQLAKFSQRALAKMEVGGLTEGWLQFLQRRITAS